MLVTGRINEIIRTLRIQSRQTNISKIATKEKLEGLCETLQLTNIDLDKLISQNPPVLRTVQGHTFETVFDHLVTLSGAKSEEVGGDTDIDRVVNGLTLQLKTPYTAETLNNQVAYKTHKTHGAKSEQESMDYYHSIESFSDFLVGLISYDPLKILILRKSELPRHPLDNNKIMSPFKINLINCQSINAFDKLGLNNIKTKEINDLIKITDQEFLPITSRLLGVSSHIVIDTILNEKNFRIWDMSIRGFAREYMFQKELNENSILHFHPSEFRRERADKADIGLKERTVGNKYFQIKGLSINLCTFDGRLSTVVVETQLTRGRINDHPTQSRLYKVTDFDYLLIAIDPTLAREYQRQLGNRTGLHWEFYCIPCSRLSIHPSFPTRYKSHQRFLYEDLQSYRVDDTWLLRWQKEIYNRGN